jgi:hypothetical protein
MGHEQLSLHFQIDVEIESVSPVTFESGA